MILTLFEKYHLVLASTRKISLLSSVCCAQGYAHTLPKYLGFSLAMGILSQGELRYNLFNEEEITRRTEEFLQKNKQKLVAIFKTTDHLLVKYQEKLNIIEQKNTTSPFNCLKHIIDFYPGYMATIGIYNSFWRYLKLKTNPLLTEQEIKEICSRREQVAKIYPRIEEILPLCASNLHLGFDGKLLLYCTFKEIQEFLKEKKLSPEKIKELENRTKGCFYLYDKENKQEFITTDNNIIKAIQERIFPNIKDKEMAEGQTAYPGLVKGIVYNILENKKIPQEAILVTYMTRPDETALISKCKAIITDEGGILCHAAVTARELKIPCIIGTKIATKIFHTGDLVEVDANKGIIKKIKN